MIIYKKRLVYHQLRKDDLKPIKVVWTRIKKETSIRVVVYMTFSHVKRRVRPKRTSQPL